MRVANTDPATVLSHGAPEAVAATIDLLCEFIGAKVVHEDLVRVRVRVSVSVRVRVRV